MVKGKKLGRKWGIYLEQRWNS